MNTPDYLSSIHLPDKSSHKAQNGKVMVIGGSHFFHAASLWSLKIATRLVDLVHYSSVTENNRIVTKLKEEFRDGIVVPRKDIERYIEEDDCVLIGPGMMRVEENEIEKHKEKLTYSIESVKDLDNEENEGWQTYYLTEYLLKKYPQKRWVIDAGALQMLNLSSIPQNSILTPHYGEFTRLISKIQSPRALSEMKMMLLEDQVRWFAKNYNCVVLLKGVQDLVASRDQFEKISGGNSGMTKGGTGDVLAGLTAGLYTKNDPWISAICASIINKQAGDDLYSTTGFWFNASDLADQIPKTMKRLLIGEESQTENPNPVKE